MEYAAEEEAEVEEVGEVEAEDSDEERNEKNTEKTSTKRKSSLYHHSLSLTQVRRGGSAHLISDLHSSLSKRHNHALFDLVYDLLAHTQDPTSSSPRNKSPSRSEESDRASGNDFLAISEAKKQRDGSGNILLALS